MKNIFETLIARFDVISIRVQFIFLLIENVSLSLCEIDRISHRTNIKIKNARNRSILFQSINEQFTSFFVISSHFNFLLSFSLTSSATSLLQRVLCSISSFFPYFYAISSKRRKTENYQISSSRFLLANDVERSNEEEQTSVGSIWSKIKCDTGKRIPVLGFPGGEWCRGFEDLVRTSPVRLTMAFPPMINNATGLNRIHDFSFVSFLSLSLPLFDILT